ncbi:hypothetical protein ACFL0C_00625 [Patescibacteria group bacterium]
MNFQEWWDQASTAERLELVKQAVSGYQENDYQRWSERDYYPLVMNSGGLGHTEISWMMDIWNKR